MREMSDVEAAKIGRMCKEALDGNLLIGSFAADALAGEGYPFNKAQWDIVFKGWTDEALGRKFAEWTERK